MPRQRLDPDVRKELIAEAAMDVCRHLGIGSLTRRAIASKAGVAEGSVSRYFNTMNQLRRFVVRRALKDEDPEILSQMLGYPEYKKMLSSAHVEIAKSHLTAG